MSLTLILLPLLALSACGGSSGSDTTTSADQAQLEAAKCFRQHGVPVPDPGPGVNRVQAFQDVAPQTLQAAQEACGKYLDQAAGDVSPSDESKFVDSFNEFAACMRDHGVNLPDISSADDVMKTVGPLSSQPNFQQAADACQNKLPTQGPTQLGTG